jgi:hypothetical protein
MSPLPGTRNGVPRRSEGAKSQESWQSGNGQADPFDPRSPEVRVGRDVIPPKGERAGIVTTSDRPDGWGEGSVGEKLKKASTAGFLRGSGGSTDSTRARGPEGGRARVTPLGGRGGRQRQEGKDPERGTSRVEGKALKGEAHGRSGASRAGRAGGGGREGGSQTSHAARGGGGIRRPRQADPPAWDCVVGRQSPGEEALRGGRPAFGSAQRRRGAGLQEHVSEGARKRRGA